MWSWYVPNKRSNISAYGTNPPQKSYSGESDCGCGPNRFRPVRPDEISVPPLRRVPIAPSPKMRRKKTLDGIKESLSKHHRARTAGASSSPTSRRHLHGNTDVVIPTAVIHKRNERERERVRLVAGASMSYLVYR